MGAVLRQGAVEQEVRHYFSDGRLAIQPKKRAMCAAVSTYEDRQSEIQTRGPWNQCAAISELGMYYIASQAMCASVADWHPASEMAKGGQ
jgi:hypothetical protein